MMKKIPKYILLSFLFLYSIETLSQFKNSTENVVYTIDNAEANSFKFSGGETSLEYNFYTRPAKYRLLKKDGSLGEITALKFHIFSIDGGLTNTKKFVDVDEFNFSKQGFLIGLNYKLSVNEIIFPKERDPFNINTISFGVKFKMDNFNNYDPQTDNIDRENPYSISFRGSWVDYHYHFEKKFAFAFSLSGSFDVVTYNSSSLINFKELDSDVINSGGVVAFKDFDGKYGTIDNEVTGGNLSASLPIFIDWRINDKLPYLVPLPFVSSKYISSDKPKYNTGIVLGFFSKSVFGDLEKDKTIKYKTRGSGEKTVVADSRKFNSPSFLSFGIDWAFQSGDSSKPNYFITGSITF